MASTNTLSSPARSPAASLDAIASLALVYQTWSNRLMLPVVALLAVMGASFAFNAPSRLPVFLATAIPAIAVLRASRHRNGLVLPIFPLYVIVQALAFIAPLTAETIQSDGRVVITPELLAQASLPLALWFVALWIGWLLTPGRILSQRPASALTDALKKPGYFTHALLLISIALQWLGNAPLLWSLSPGLASGLLTPLRTCSTLALMVGVFTGVYAWSVKCLRLPFVWLILYFIPFFQSLGSLLLSSAGTMLIATLLGLWLGRSRYIIPLTLVILLTLGFLHNSKAVMRERYWAGGDPLPANPVEFFNEWIAASQVVSDSGQSSNFFNQRFNSLVNLLFVEQQLSRGYSTLGGESLRLVPQAMVPRILYSDKGRSHDGQVLLNLHFGRQLSLQDTETAYISWGFLAEGVANYGSFLGPLIMGSATGLLIRLSENIGRGQLLLSTPGLVSLLMMVFWMYAYEMAASTFAAAIFQRVIVVILVGWWFGRRSIANAAS